MHTYKKTFSKEGLELLELINAHPRFKNFYLAGGTSLALQIGHRESIDLDFFTDTEFPSNLIDSLNIDYTVIGIHDNSIEVIINGVKVFFFYFAFPLRNELKIIDGVRFADPLDIGLMKLLALQGRTTRKDIIDLYFIDKKVVSLEILLQIFQTHYPKEKFNTIDSLKSLLDSSVLALQPMPKMLKPFDWEKDSEYVVKKLIKSVSKSLVS